MDRDEVALDPGHPADAGPDHPDGVRRRLRRQARPGVHPLIALAAWRTGRPSGRVDAARIHGRQPEAPPRSHPSDGGRRRRGPAAQASASTATSTPAPTPRGGPRSRIACLSTRWAPTAGTPSSRPPAPSTRTTARRRVPRLRRPAGRDRPRDAPRRSRRRSWPRSAGASDWPTPSAPGDRTPSGQAPCSQRRPPGVPRGAPAALAASCAPPRTLQNATANGGPRQRHRHRGHVVRHRQHRAREPIDDRDGRHARRPGRAAVRRGGHRPGGVDRPRADRGRCPRRRAPRPSSS